jgi:hypothetical protein
LEPPDKSFELVVAKQLLPAMHSRQRIKMAQGINSLSRTMLLTGVVPG